jgi:hypothetical protein
MLSDNNFLLHNRLSDKIMRTENMLLCSYDEEYCTVYTGML